MSEQQNARLERLLKQVNSTATNSRFNWTSIMAYLLSFVTIIAKAVGFVFCVLVLVSLSFLPIVMKEMEQIAAGKGSKRKPML